MAEHTSTPWDVIEATENHGAFIINGWGGTICDLYCMSNPLAASVRNGGDSYPVPFADMAENAAFILKAVNNHDALVTALTAAREAIWNGGDTISALSKIDTVLASVGQVGSSGK